MSGEKIDTFNERAPLLFQPILERYGYVLEEVLPIYFNDVHWASHHIYVNPVAELKVILKEEPCYTDYGFSFCLYRLGTEKYNVLYNVPYEKQDVNGSYLDLCCEELFADREMTDLLRGLCWKELSYIPFQK